MYLHIRRTCDNVYAYLCMLFNSRIRVRVRIKLRFSVWLVSVKLHLRDGRTDGQTLGICCI